MKLFFTLISVLALNATSQSQLLKKIVRDVKNEAEWKARSKANQKVDQALDSLLTKKETEKKKNNSDQQTTEPSNNKPISPKSSIQSSAKKEPDDEMNSGEGFIKLSVSAEEVFRNGTVVVMGSSVKYGNLKQVKLHTTGPDTDETETLSLSENGTFSTAWQAEKPGDFVITATSSDGKSKESKKVTVLEMELTDWNENEKQIEAAHKKLRKEVDRVEQNIGQKDKAELEKKMDEVEEKIKLANKLFEDLGVAMKELGMVINKGASPTPELRNHLSQLNDLMNTQRREMEKINEVTDHEPSDNTICEYLTMLTEACAAFSTITNLWSKSATTILKNIVMDKVLPKGVEIVNAKAGIIPPDYDAQFKQPAKIFASSKLDADALLGKLNAASFTGDIVQFASDFLMKKYCGLFKGELNHDYKITYRNKNGIRWWSYSYKTAAAVTFRYPKTSTGKIIKMKGNIEGNATSFDFFQDVEEMDDFKEQMKGRASLAALPLIIPVAVPFATSQKDELGFGAVARGLATPSYFNIPVDAEYDTDAETIKLFLNEAIIDFTPMVRYKYGYIAFAAGIPLVTTVDFPIDKAKLTLNAVVSQNNELKVTKEGTSISGKGSRHIGSNTSEIEHQINYTLTAKKQ